MKKVKISFKFNPNEIALNQRKFITSEIGRGTGIIKSKKGKGGYQRHDKHRRNQNHEDFVYFIAI